MRKLHIIFICIIIKVVAAHATTPTDTISFLQSHLSYELKYSPGTLLAIDEYGDKFIKNNQIHLLAIEVHYNTTPNDSNLFDHAYNYPRLSAGIRYGMNHGVKMHRNADPSWGSLVPVDYDTPLGNSITLYGTFERPILRGRSWVLATYLGTGIGYFHKKYNRSDQIDNELIGSHLNIFFTGGLVATWQFAHQWALRGGVDFSHHSNGATNRPNKGANYFCPFVGVEYCWNNQDNQKNPSIQSNQSNLQASPFFLDFTLGIGLKTLEEEWQRTQFGTAPDQPDYRTDHFRRYMCYSLQTAWMYRYGVTRASGAGLDIFYGTYSDHIRKIDEAAGSTVSHSPWSVALAARHNVYYRNLSARFAIGYYLYRHMGVRADNIEKPYYERIGLHYSIPQLHNISIGFNVKAHLLKADLTELQVSIPFRLE